MRYQGRRQTSEQDESIFERRRSEPLGGSGGMFPPPPKKILKYALVSIFRGIFLQKKSILGKCRSSLFYSAICTIRWILVSGYDINFAKQQFHLSRHGHLVN